jgi:glycosyltransferase involved in cell wall biosynthesis/GT2 family glycosyltransferase
MNGPKLMPGLSALTYAYLPEHAFLAPGFDRPEGPNIGRNGENLTIMFLSMDRPKLTERLCRSIVEHIPNFSGEILAVDNGSQAAELAEVRAMLDALPLKTRLVELGENFGVAGGRNLGVTHVRTEWVMSVDNDIYFIIDPIQQWQDEIAAVGCRFFSLALYDPGLETVFLRGGNLYVHYAEGEIHLGGGSVGDSTDARSSIGDVFLGTCMMGGASIFDVKKFQNLGGFESNMFVGFEDVEFSLRLFREGYKVGCSGLAALVHDHPKPETEVDKNYEGVRFKRNYIEESARFFENKHGFKIWNQGVDEWLRDREDALGLQESRQAVMSDRAEVCSPKLLLVTDVDGWAFSNIANQLSKHLGDIYDIETVAMGSIDATGQIPLVARDKDLVHFFWRPALSAIGGGAEAEYARSIGHSSYYDYAWNLFGRRVTTAIYDHLFLEPEARDYYSWVLSGLSDAYYTSSDKLTEIYRSAYPDILPAATLPDGVDLELFAPRRLDRLKELDRPLVVGWVGNSKWASEQEDFKGFHSIVTPVLQEMQAEGFNIEGRFADRNVKFTPHVHMPDYYAEIDVLICASKIEGTPNPVLEAMACGVPVISTDVGIVPEALGVQQKNFILKNRSARDLKAALRKIYNERHWLAELSRENLQQVKAWDWAIRARNFQPFFDDVLSRPPKTKAVRL